MSKKKPAGAVRFEDFVPDFSDDECERRTAEIVRRACGQPASFDLATGQPFSGPQIAPAELKRRGYDV